MALVFSLSPASDVPIYRQITQHIRSALAQGRLQRGEQLPAVRALAEDLVINPNTVARAYQELIRDGLLESRSGVGVFVVEEIRQVFSEPERQRRLQLSAETLAYEAAALNFTLPETQEAVKNAWKPLTARPKKSK